MKLPRLQLHLWTLLLLTVLAGAFVGVNVVEQIGAPFEYKIRLFS